MAFKVVKQDDPGYTVSDGLLVGNRAFLEIDAECPNRVRRIIQESLNQGWIRMNVTFTEEEYTWLMLQE
jgi:hypothetical protein